MLASFLLARLLLLLPELLNSLFAGLDQQQTLKLQLDPLASIEHLLCGNAKRESEKGDRDGAEADSVEAGEEASRYQRS